MLAQEFNFPLNIPLATTSLNYEHGPTVYERHNTQQITPMPICNNAEMLKIQTLEAYSKSCLTKNV